MKESPGEGTNLHNLTLLAIESNNAAAYILKKGDRDEAMTLLSVAIEAMSRQLNADITTFLRNNEEAQRAIDLITKVRQDPNSQELNCHVETPKKHFPVTVQTNFPSKSDGFVYNQALTIQPSFISNFDGQEEALRCILSSVMVFNLALVHHLAYLEGPGHKDLLDALKKLYKMADRLSDECLRDHLDDKYILLDLRIALLNNSAVVYHDLCQYDRSKYYLRKLALCIRYGSYLKKTSKGKCISNINGNKVSVIEGEFRQHLAMNVMYLKEPSIAGAA